MPFGFTFDGHQRPSPQSAGEGAADRPGFSCEPRPGAALLEVALQ